ncbi:MAG: GIY-YIG nuclease family protein [Candidatus Omnitrophica bacterium]|nr:GIY-YIG nuclease family protein [Candidatus Omnitrophota bacterium]
MDDFYYVYILQSIADKNRYYVGLTNNLDKRLIIHNNGACAHTSKYCPWHITNTIAFKEKAKAVAFEKYLKSHSGRAFAKKHF